MSKVAPTYAEFIARFPAFSSIAETEVTAIIAESVALLSVSAWGEMFSNGVMYDAAHNLAMDHVLNSELNGGQQAAAGPVTSSSAAGISISFDSPKYNEKNASDSWYSKTAYGQKFMRLRNTVVPAGYLSVGL